MARKIKAWLARQGRLLPALGRQVLSTARGTLDVLLPCLLVLALTATLASLQTALGWPDGLGTLLQLLQSIVILPLAAGMITYAAGARWEGRGARLADAVQLARIRFKQIVLTGLAAGLIVLFISWFASMFYSLIGLLPALLGWIPLLGPVISMLAACCVWLVALLMEFIAHVALVTGMLALTADGISGRPQVQRVIQIIVGVRENTLPELALVFGFWVIVYSLRELAAWAMPLGGVPLSGLLPALGLVISMLAVCVIYLKERDRQEGMRFR